VVEGSAPEASRNYTVLSRPNAIALYGNEKRVADVVVDEIMVSSLRNQVLSHFDILGPKSIGQSET
jgi:hypothetical protein